MKRMYTLLLTLLVASGAGAQDQTGAARHDLQAAKVPPRSAAAVKPTKHWPVERQVTKAKLADLKADVVRDMRDTSAFVEESTNVPASPSRWLIGLAAVGMVMIQLRRKHRSLLMQRVAPYT